MTNSGRQTLPKPFNQVKQLCIVLKNIPYSTYKQKLAQQNEKGDKENWSPNSNRRLSHRVFTDSTEKQAVEQLSEQH